MAAVRAGLRGSLLPRGTGVHMRGDATHTTPRCNMLLYYAPFMRQKKTAYIGLPFGRGR